MAEPPVLVAASKPEKGKADKTDAKGAATPAAGGKKKLIIIIAAAVVLLGGGGAAAFFMMSGKPDATAAEGKGKAKSAKAAKPEKEKKEKEEPPPKGPPLFVALDPPFVVNFQSDQAVRFLQVTAQIMSRDPETIEVLKANDPIIRNDLLLLFGNQNSQAVSTLEGKEKLRAEALEAVRKVVTNAGGKPKHVESVLFTSFVMQ